MIKRIVDILLVLFFIIFFVKNSEAVGWFGTDWQYRGMITIDETKVSTVGNTDLTNFPVLISTTSAEWMSTANGGFVAQSDGGDIVFTSSDGTTQLDHQIEKYDPTTGQLIAWVEVPTLSASTNTILYIYYGNNTGVADQWDITGVWNSNFKGVWHLNSAYTDSTSNANDGTNNGSSSATGLLANGISLDGNDYVSLPTSMAGSNIGSVAMWIKFTTNFTTNPAVLFYGTSAAGGNGFGEENEFHPYIDVVNEQAGLFIEGSGASGDVYATGGASLKDGFWHYVTFTWDISGNAIVYVDGVSVASATHDAENFTFSSSTYLGTTAALQRFFTGSMDEVQLSDSVRSPDWIITSYNNQNLPGAFYSLSLTTRLRNATIR